MSAIFRTFVCLERVRTFQECSAVFVTKATNWIGVEGTALVTSTLDYTQVGYFQT